MFWNFHFFYEAAQLNISVIMFPIFFMYCFYKSMAKMFVMPIIISAKHCFLSYFATLHNPSKKIKPKTQSVEAALFYYVRKSVAKVVKHGRKESICSNLQWQKLKLEALEFLHKITLANVVF